MDLMKKIILCACFLSIVITISDSIKPGDKFNQQLKMIFSLIFITALLSVIVKNSNKFNLPDFNGVKNSNNYSNIEDAADKAVIKETENQINDKVKKMLYEKDISFENIYSFINIGEDNSIIINRIDYKGSEFEQAQKSIVESLGEVEVNLIE